MTYTVKDLITELLKYPAESPVTSATVKVRVFNVRSTLTIPGERNRTPPARVEENRA